MRIGGLNGHVMDVMSDAGDECCFLWCEMSENDLVTRLTFWFDKSHMSHLMSDEDGIWWYRSGFYHCVLRS